MRTVLPLLVALSVSAAATAAEPPPGRPTAPRERCSPGCAEVRELAKAKKLPEPLNALYDGRPRDMIEVFDLTADPSEFVNLAGKPEAAAAEKELRAALLEWMILERDFLPLPVSNPGAKK